MMGDSVPGEATLGEVLRTHHDHVMEGIVDLAAVPALERTVFAFLTKEAKVLEASPLTARMAQLYVLGKASLPEAIGHSLANKLIVGGAGFSANSAGGHDDELDIMATYRNLLVEHLARPRTLWSLLADLAKAWVADPAIVGLFQPCFFFKGFQAVTTYRVAHGLWIEGGECNRGAALLLQSRMAELFAVDIHPAATVGDGVMLDHASGIGIHARVSNHPVAASSARVQHGQPRERSTRANSTRELHPRYTRAAPELHPSERSTRANSTREPVRGQSSAPRPSWEMTFTCCTSALSAPLASPWEKGGGTPRLARHAPSAQAAPS